MKFFCKASCGAASRDVSRRADRNAAVASLRLQTERKTNRSPVIAILGKVYNMGVRTQCKKWRDLCMGDRSGKVILGLILLTVGALLFLDLLGIDTGDLIGFLIPGAIMLFGAKRVVQGSSAGKKAWGAFLFLFGLLMLIGKLDLLFSCMLAIMAIYFGFRLIRRESRPVQHVPDIVERRWAEAVLKEDALDRWEREYQARKLEP